MDLVAIVTLLGIVQGCFMGGLLLLSKGPNRRANRFLGALFICYSLSILHFFLESLGANFFDFINGYRVEEAKRLFKDPSKSAYTILAIAEDAGFNSKSAFNAVFKRVAGQTPSEFRQDLQKNTPLTAAA